MGIRGSISTMGLPDVFQWMKLGSKTGVLLVERVNRSTQIFFQKGAIADLREQNQAPVLLWFLARAGFPVSEIREPFDLAQILPQIAKRMAPNRADGSLQQALLLLEEPIRNFFTNRLLDLFGWEFGEFSFRDAQTSGRSLLIRPVELEPLMLDWADRTLELQPLREILPDSPRVGLEAQRAESQAVHDIDRHFLRILRTPQPLLDVLSRSSLTEFESLKHLHRMVTSGLIAVHSLAEAQAEAATPDTVESDPVRSGPRTIWQQFPLVEDHPQGALIAETFRRLRAEVSGRPELTGLSSDAIPKMLISYDSPQLMHLKLSPDEGYLLSRVDGQTPLRQLSALSGLNREATAELILSLIVRGVLEAIVGKAMIRPATIDKAEILLQQALNPLHSRQDGARNPPLVEIDWGDETAAARNKTPGRPVPAAAPSGNVVAQPSQRQDAPGRPKPTPVRPAATLESESLAEAASMLHALHTSPSGQPIPTPAAPTVSSPPQAAPSALSFFTLDDLADESQDPTPRVDSPGYLVEDDPPSVRIQPSAAQPAPTVVQPAPAQPTPPPAQPPSVAQFPPVVPSPQPAPVIAPPPVQPPAPVIQAPPVVQAPPAQPVLQPQPVVQAPPQPVQPRPTQTAPPHVAQPAQPQPVQSRPAAAAPPQVAQPHLPPPDIQPGTPLAPVPTAPQPSPSDDTAPRELAELYMKLGIRALKEQQYRKAIQLLNDALAQDASDSNCWAALAQAYLMDGVELEEAERCCRRALEGNDWNSRLHLLLGYIHRSRERPDLAAASFFRALELDHTNPQIQEALRSLYLH